MGNEELKSCPFCGSEAEYIEDKAFSCSDWSATSETMSFVWCLNCSALVSGKNKAEAVEQWNRRVGEDNAELD